MGSENADVIELNKFHGKGGRRFRWLKSENLDKNPTAIA